MFGCCGKVVIEKNEGTIIFGNIKQFAPSMNEVTVEPAGSEETNEETSGNTEAGVSGRMNRKAKRGRARVCRKKRGRNLAFRKHGKTWIRWTPV